MHMYGVFLMESTRCMRCNTLAVFMILCQLPARANGEDLHHRYVRMVRSLSLRLPLSLSFHHVFTINICYVHFFSSSYVFLKLPLGSKLQTSGHNSFQLKGNSDP